ncbi:hypothetical protein ABVK25_011540 [Lepraria finkii]|uniref:Uncharacterized protein n=1 Tax=Lepraria finkii TaxID=1340010 RepID=A0ABR4ARJ1_9LECA
MSATTVTETASTTPITYAKLRYVTADWAPKPISQPFGLPDVSEYGDERLLPTAKEGTAQLLTHGFTAVKHPSSLHSSPYTAASWRDPELVQKIYVAEVEEMLKRITGAKTVITEALLMRGVPKSGHDVPSTNTGHGQDTSTKEASTEAPEKTQAPLPAHLQDKTLFKLKFPNLIGFSPFLAVYLLPPKPMSISPLGCPHPHPALPPHPDRRQRPHHRRRRPPPCRQLHPSPPITPPPPMRPGDVRSFVKEDYVQIDVPAPTIGSDGENKGMHIMKAYVAKGSEEHRWCYVSEQMPDEVVVLGLWDSDREGDSVAAGGAMHSSAELQGREGEEARESLELRCTAIW